MSKLFKKLGLCMALCMTLTAAVSVSNVFTSGEVCAEAYVQVVPGGTGFGDKDYEYRNSEGYVIFAYCDDGSYRCEMFGTLKPEDFYDGFITPDGSVYVRDDSSIHQNYIFWFNTTCYILYRRA